MTTTVKAIIIVLVVAVLGTAGYFIWKEMEKKKGSGTAPGSADQSRNGGNSGGGITNFKGTATSKTGMSSK